ncbi:uncharacterized protein FIBRA_02888 [Fibroporia radiculosa]|uniref:Uncharacterized protein n=1 Tax=Fibroporia radiculosa TaxID=599839 RepID=J4I9B0_9APHY|nr:uncharacterized protein FIBRA_02888 [Fibroporia radiculosa]CCM00846.1 predicted protein [Fibroporia radiculosa]
MHSPVGVVWVLGQHAAPLSGPARTVDAAFGQRSKASSMRVNRDLRIDNGEAPLENGLACSMPTRDVHHNGTDNGPTDPGEREKATASVLLTMRVWLTRSNKTPCPSATAQPAPETKSYGSSASVQVFGTTPWNAKDGLASIFRGGEDFLIPASQ